MMAQVKILALQGAVDKLKGIVLAKYGKLGPSAEGEKALKLCVKRYERLLGGLCPPDKDPLTRICGIGRSSRRHNVLKDLKKLESGEL
jgi:hypothetical protein